MLLMIVVGLLVLELVFFKIRYEAGWYLRSSPLNRRISSWISSLMCLGWKGSMVRFFTGIKKEEKSGITSERTTSRRSSKRSSTICATDTDSIILSFGETSSPSIRKKREASDFIGELLCFRRNNHLASDQYKPYKAKWFLEESVRLDFWEENIIFTFVLGGAPFILLQYDACKAKILSAIPYLSSVTFGGWDNEAAAQTV